MEEKKKPIAIGDVLYCIFPPSVYTFLCKPNRVKSNRNEPHEIVEVTVGKVGKKYFYLTGWEGRYPINIETLKYTNEQYSQSNFQLYRDKQEILDIREKERLTDLLYKHFNWSGNKHKNTIEQLRKAAEILGVS